MTSPERQREFAATISGSRFLTIGESDHWVVLERAVEVAELVSRFFLEGTPAATPVSLPQAPRWAGPESLAPGPRGQYQRLLIFTRTTCGPWSLAWSANSALMCTTS
ncbi:hypothetical protein SMICM17S_11584 [Streptomyces microflavus]